MENIIRLINRTKGRGFQNCNCNYGCPCQFNALPTYGNSEAVMGYAIEQGNFGEINLDGLRIAGVYSWPSPVHEGDGRMQLIIDESANDQQRVLSSWGLNMDYSVLDVAGL